MTSATATASPWRCLRLRLAGDDRDFQVLLCLGFRPCGPKSCIFLEIFHCINHPAIGVPPHFRKAPDRHTFCIALDNEFSQMHLFSLNLPQDQIENSMLSFKIHMYKLFGQIPGDLCMISFWCGKTLGLNLDILQQRIGFQVGMDNTADLHKSTYIPTNISHRGPFGHGTYISLFPDRVFSHWTPSRFPRRKENPITGHLWPSTVYHWLVVTDDPPSQSSLSKVNSHNLKVAEFGNMVQ